MEPVDEPDTLDEPDTQEIALVAPLRLSVLDVVGRGALAIGVTVPALFVVALMMAVATR